MQQLTRGEVFFLRVPIALTDDEHPRKMFLKASELTEAALTSSQWKYTSAPEFFEQIQRSLSHSKRFRGIVMHSFSRRQQRPL